MIIFSQWTQFLDLIQIPMKKEFKNFIRVDGTMDSSSRDESFNKFKEQDDCKIALLSLHACGVGLNLSEANHVLFCDPWWNPMVEQQAIDRTHRIGQEKIVHIYKFLVYQTVEQKIKYLQMKKQRIADEALGELNSATSDTLSVSDLEFLFSSRSYFAPVNSQ